MRNTLWIIIIVIGLLLVPAEAQIHRLKPDGVPIAQYLKDWSQNTETREVLSEPSILGQLIEEKDLSDFDQVPTWIADNLVRDENSLKKLNARLDIIYKQILEARRLKIVYFKNQQPFFALGNRSLIFISTTSVESLSQNEFAAAGFHEIAHLLFAEYYWNLRRAGETAAVKQIELNCDRFAYLMLKRSGIPVKCLEQLLRRIQEMENKSQPDQFEAQFYPTLEERLANIKNSDPSSR